MNEKKKNKVKNDLNLKKIQISQCNANVKIL